MSQETRCLLAAALSAAIDSLVLPNPPLNENNPSSERSNINYYELNIHKSHLVIGPVSRTKYTVVASGTEEILIQSAFNNSNLLSLKRKNISKNLTSIYLTLTSTVQELKLIIQARKNVSFIDQELIFNGQILRDHLTLIEYNIRRGSIIKLKVLNNFIQNEELEFDNKMIERASAESTEVGIISYNGKSIAYINPNQLHSQFDYDLSYIVDHKKYYRGGLEYHRPCSWKRFALRVLNKYESNIWLGVQNDTNKNDNNFIYTRKSEYDSVPNEWLVSYHATGTLNDTYTMADIGNLKIKTNFKLLGKYIMNKLFINKNKNNMKKIFTYGRGIYTTPNIYLARQFASKFEFDGVRYLVLFQNRVNPHTLVKFGDYWISPKAEDVKTYGICINRDPYQK